MNIHIGIDVALWNNFGNSCFSPLTKHFNINEYADLKFNGQFKYISAQPTPLLHVWDSCGCQVVGVHITTEYLLYNKDQDETFVLKITNI